MEASITTILFLAPNPHNTSWLRIDEELRDIQEKLKRALRADKFKLEYRSAVRARDVLEATLDIKPQIVHFSGHGTETGELCLEDDQGKSQPVQPLALAELFRLVSEDVKCVVINTCYSEEQVKAIVENIPFVIGMRTSVGDRAAIEFAVGFYTALGSGQSIEKAYEFGRVAIQLRGITGEHLTPILMFGDPRKRFRTEIERYQNQLQIKKLAQLDVYRLAFQEKGREMGLSLDDIELIIDEVFDSIQEVERKKLIYRQALTDAIRVEFPLSEETNDALQFLQKTLGFQDSDIEPLKHQIVSNPRWQTSKSFLDRGIAQYEQKNYQEALKYYDKAIEIQKNYSRAYVERGITYSQLGNNQAAIEDYRRAIEINSDWEDVEPSSVFYEMGLSYSTLGNKKAAIENYTQAINHKSDYFDAYAARGYVYNEINKQEDAVQDYNKAIEIKTWNINNLARAYLDRGLIHYYSHNNKEAALSDWDEVIKLRPNYSLAFYNRAHIYSDLGRKLEAIQDFTKSIEINSDWGVCSLKDAYLKRGRTYYEMGDIQSATKDFRKAGTSLESYLSDLYDSDRYKLDLSRSNANLPNPNLDKQEDEAEEG